MSITISNGTIQVRARFTDGDKRYSKNYTTSTIIVGEDLEDVNVQTNKIYSLNEYSEIMN